MIGKEFCIENRRHQKIAVKAYLPDETSGKTKFPALIFAHGFNGNYNGLMHHGNGYADQGIICFFFDFCGGGIESKSDGRLNEMTILTEIDDLNDVIDYVKSLDNVDEDNLFLQGESMGGFVSAYVAADRVEDIKGLILWYPAFVMPDDSKKRFEVNDNTCFGLELSPDFNETSMNIDIYSQIRKYNRKTIIIHGDHDEIVPISYSQKAVETFEDSKLVTISNAGHGFDGGDSDFARNESISFVKEVISYESTQ